MKKGSKIILTSAALGMLLGGLVGCGGGGGGGTPAVKLPFSFDAELDTGRELYIYQGENEKLRIVEYNPEEGVDYSYTKIVSMEAGDTQPWTKYVDISDMKTDDQGKYFEIKPKLETGTFEREIEGGEKITVERSIYVQIVYKAKRIMKKFQVKKPAVNAQDGYNWAASGKIRQQVLGKLEKYAMDNFLTGISLFENGGYVKYSARADAGIPASQYITGYGWGLLADGTLNGTLPGVTDSALHPSYYQTASSSDPLSMNAWDATGSQVSDLNGYITSSYYGTRLKGTNDYEWYPLLAQDEYSRPVINETTNPSGLYTKWRIYVKTGAFGGLKYRYNGTDAKKSTYDNKLVELKDYLDVYQALLTAGSGVTRGAELAGDTTYGIKGAAQFYRETKSFSKLENGDALSQALWDEYIGNGTIGLGIGAGTSKDTSYIDIELINPIDQFTAMYTLSSNLYSPMPLQFLKDIGGGSYTQGTKNFGTFPNGVDTDARENILCLGPFFVEEWVKRSVTTFARNDDWFEHKAGRYKIDGVRIKIIETATEDPTALWKEFTDNKLDSAGVPSTVIQQSGIPAGSRMNGGDSTFKLNVNSCTQEEWNRLFGPNGKVNPQPAAEAYSCKPWMSNKNFLKGLYWAINRPQFAQARGVSPSFNYFSDTYMADPESRRSYNTTDEHLDAVANWHGKDAKGNENYGFSLEQSKNYFKKAVKELVDNGDIQEGTASNPTDIHINIWWMYTSNIREYGTDIANYFTNAFNDEEGIVSGGKVRLVVDQYAVTNWEDVYNQKLMKGQFDLGFGAISGNSYNPLNFMEVLKSDNSSGFTLNWGVNTSMVDPVNPILYAPEGEEERAWSYDGLWAAADHGAIITAGRDISAVQNCYLTNVSKNELYEGGTFDIYFNFSPVTNAVLDVKKVQFYLAGVGYKKLFDTKEEFEANYNPETKLLHITISAADGGAWNTLLFNALELQKEIDKPGTSEEEKELLRHPFSKANYGRFWEIEFRYSMQISGASFVSENTFSAFGSESDQIIARS